MSSRRRRRRGDRGRALGRPRGARRGRELPTSRAVPDRRRPQRPHRHRGALLLALSARTRPTAEVTVKRTVDGYGSNWICDNLRAGETLRSLPPSGIFTPARPRRRPAALRRRQRHHPGHLDHQDRAREGQRQGLLFYANRDEQSVIFAAELAGWPPSTPTGSWSCTGWSACRGCPTPEHMKAFAAPFTDRTTRSSAARPVHERDVAACRELGFPRERRHQEKFISLGGNPFGDLDEDVEAEHELEEADSDEADRGAPRRPSRSAPADGGPAAVEVELDGEDFSLRRLAARTAARLPARRAEGAVLLPRGQLLRLRRAGCSRARS